MKKLLTYFFCTLGVIFFLLLCVGSYIWFADPFEVRPLISAFTSSEIAPPVVGAPAVDKNPALSPTQESALENIGIDPASIPSTITPDQEACFITKLGSARVAEIKAGDTPSAAEFFTARSCIE